MHAIGIDMSKDAFHAAFDDTLVREYPNTEDGITQFITTAEELGYRRKQTRVGVESTGVYHLFFSVRLHERGWDIRVINPLLTAQMIAAGLRMVKNDRKDAKIVRLAVLAGKGYPFLDTPEILALKALVSEREDIVSMRADLKRRQHAHVIRARASGIALHDSYAPAFAALEAALEQIDGRLHDYAAGTQRLLRSITGIGAVTGALLVAYVGDINRFASPEQLVAYVGVDPRVKQSGTSIHGKGFITKRGSALLRHTLYQAAFVATRYDSELRAYYRKKRSEGKHHTAVLCAVERKLIHRIYAVWKRGTPYVKSPKT
jgi:transposase